MKLYSTLLTGLISISCLAQSTSAEPSPTTEEEYNYLTKGYKVQIESGLDMKKGYVLQDMGEVKRSSYEFAFKGLVREQKNELAAILAIVKSSVSGKSYYVAIPIGNSDLMERYWKDIDYWDENLTTNYCLVISAYMSSVMSTAFELDKKVKK
jgi:hypothetical protein